MRKVILLNISPKIIASISIVSAAPIIRQLVVFKLLAGDELAEYLFLSSMLLSMAPLMHLGWGDLFARHLAVDLPKCIRHHQGSLFLSIFFTILISVLVFLVMILVGYSILLGAVFSLNVCIVSLFQNLVRLYRSINRIDRFFLWLSIKSALDVSAFLLLFILGIKCHVTLLMSAELLTGFLTLTSVSILLAGRRPAFIANIKGYFCEHNRMAFSIVCYNIIAVMSINIDRIILKPLIHADIYNMYMFAIINTSLLYSLYAFISHFMYPRLAAKVNDYDGLMVYVKRYISVVLLVAVAAIPIQSVVFILFNSHYYHGLPVSIYQVLLAVMLGWMGISLINEVVLFLRLDTLHLIANGAVAVLLYIGCLLAMRISGMLENVYSCYIPLFISKIYYLWRINKRALTKIPDGVVVEELV